MSWTPTPEQHAALIRAHALAREMHDGRATLNVIAESLTAGGYPTMRGGPWTYQAVHRFLRASLPAGPSPKYGARHHRVRTARGDASGYLCAAECGKQAEVWATLKDTDGMRPEDYQPMCQKCHLDYDGITGSPRSAETRAKMSAYAANRTPEHQARLNESRTGAKRGAQAIANMQAGQQRRRQREQERDAPAVGETQLE